MKSTARASWVRVVMILLALSSCWISCSAAATSELEQGFRRPPAAARPWVYWFWLNGNITRAGITADLEAMQRAGIGGVLIMEVDQGAPAGPAAFMSPPWRELFQHVVAEAQRLGLEVNMNNDAGWNGSGGPWITPEQSMQEVTWTETEIAGPRKFQGELPQPEAKAGFYRDIVVQAFPSVGQDYLPNFEAQAAFQSRGHRPEVPPGAAPRAPSCREYCEPDRCHGPPRTSDVGCAGGNLDGGPHRPHLYGSRECSGPTEWSRPGV